METSFKAGLISLAVLCSVSACRTDVSENLPAEPVVSESIPPATTRQLIEKLENQGYKTFQYVDEASKDTLVMQQYFMVFLKRGSEKSEISDSELDSLQILHLAHLSRMYEEGYADISGPFGDDGDIRGVTIYNTRTLEEADSLANLDPMVQSGRLTIEVHPWWAAKGFPLR